jgi:hypothetical protein
MRMRPAHPRVLDEDEPTVRVSLDRDPRPAPVNSQHDKPVFLDRSGRRRHGMMFVFVGAGVLAVLLLTTLTLALTGNSPVSLPGFPDATRNAGRPQVAVTPSSSRAAPHGSGVPLSGSSVATPSLSATTPGAGVTPTPSVTHGKKPTDTPSHPQSSRTR